MITRSFIEKVHDAFDELNYRETQQLDFNKFEEAAVKTLTHCKDLPDAINAVCMYQFCLKKWNKIVKIFDKKLSVFNEYDFEDNSLITVVSDKDALGTYYITIAMILHYCKNKEINGNLKYVRPRAEIIKAIYKIGISAALMQALLSVMMAGMNAILGAANADSTILVGSFGIYYKIQQIALFSAFGLSNTIITILSFNYGMKDKARSIECIKYGILDTLITTLIITILFEIIAVPLSKLFALSGGSSEALVGVCAKATRIASLSFIFMGFNVAVQGVLQALGYAVKPLVTAFLRLVAFAFPVAYLFTLSDNVLNLVWWTFIISEALTCVVSALFLKRAIKNKIEKM